MVGVAARRSIEQIEKTSAIRPSRFLFLVFTGKSQIKRKSQNGILAPTANAAAALRLQR
jgi:hypothetical protein